MVSQDFQKNTSDFLSQKMETKCHTTGSIVFINPKEIEELGECQNFKVIPQSSVLLQC